MVPFCVWDVEKMFVLLSGTDSIWIFYLHFKNNLRASGMAKQLCYKIYIAAAILLRGCSKSCIKFGLFELSEVLRFHL